MERQLPAPYEPQSVPHVSAAIESLLAEYGMPATIKALLQALLLRPRRRDATDADLTERLRRDIGLLPEPRTRHYWELR